ncbi:MAG: ABC transporter ATP-binding protein [Granulosicoccus sp.]|nr:ABC transporter ATP-binding protein [Granulosicoccus sp.]
MPVDKPLLQVEELHICVGHVPLLRGVRLHIDRGEMLGLVGESGSGKSLTALSIMGLLESPPMETRTGRIQFNDLNIVDAKDTTLESIRGNRIAMIFQEPMTSLNPVFTIGDQITEALYLHRDIAKQDANREAAELLERVGITPSTEALARFPHQLSGGQRQRVMIAMAISCNPDLLIADEPTTALDVTVQAQILELLDHLRSENSMSVLLIAHDLGVVRHYCDRVAVMYCGQIVELASAEELFSAPKHPYTLALLNTIPAVNPRGIELPSIPGNVPSPNSMPTGCAFAPRCNRASTRCEKEEPALTNELHAVRCWHPVTINELNKQTFNG